MGVSSFASILPPHSAQWFFFPRLSGTHDWHDFPLDSWWDREYIFCHFLKTWFDLEIVSSLIAFEERNSNFVLVVLWFTCMCSKIWDFLVDSLPNGCPYWYFFSGAHFRRKFLRTRLRLLLVNFYFPCITSYWNLMIDVVTKMKILALYRKEKYRNRTENLKENSGSSQKENQENELHLTEGND